MVTTKKTTVQYTRKEIKKECKHFTMKNQLDTADDRNAGYQG